MDYLVSENSITKGPSARPLGIYSSDAKTADERIDDVREQFYAEEPGARGLAIVDVTPLAHAQASDVEWARRLQAERRSAAPSPHEASYQEEHDAYVASLYDEDGVLK